MTKRKKQDWFELTIIFTMCVFFTMLTSLFTVYIGIYLLDHSHYMPENEIQHVPLLLFAFISLMVGTILAAIFSNRPLAPLRKIIDASNQIANGNYNVYLEKKGPKAFRQLSSSFNHMADELGSVEMLRNDFVNNFSHEFKTPIVSIRGFAKMLKRNDLSIEERDEYLDIIISESERLTELATNVLNLSKIEQQSIVTDRTRFNISEQIRLVIALLDHKWSDKHIDISFDNNEVFINGNEEQLQQVWINLLDNAIKFSPEYESISIQILCSQSSVCIHFSNYCSDISDDKIFHIFDKFYQGDRSHTTSGNGLGLTIAKRIIELHNGTIQAHLSDDTHIQFEIALPLEQE